MPALVTAWVLLTAPLLAASLLYLGFHVPSLASAMAGSVASLATAIGSGDLSEAVVDGLSSWPWPSRWSG